jgi:hypothetical protein
MKVIGLSGHAWAWAWLLAEMHAMTASRAYRITLGFTLFPPEDDGLRPRIGGEFMFAT